MANADLEFSNGWLEELMAVWEEVSQQGNRVGLVGSDFHSDEPRRYHITSGTGYVTGHCWLVSMYALYEISARRGMPGWYLDETQQRTIHIFSDNEACYSMNSLGWTTVVSYKSAVGHHGGKSWGHDLGKVWGLRLQDVND